MRDELDRYYTPDWLARLIVDELEVEAPRGVLEPSVGGGAFVRAVRQRWGDVHVSGVDLDPRAEGLAHVEEPIDGDLLDVELPPEDRVDLVVGNPPYRHAEAHARRLLDEEYTVVCLLLRIGFLASAERIEFWRDYPLTELLVVSNRPSFTGNGLTDGSEYAAFVWRRRGSRGRFDDCNQRIRWLARPHPHAHEIRWRTVQ